MVHIVIHSMEIKENLNNTVMMKINEFIVSGPNGVPILKYLCTKTFFNLDDPSVWA